MYCGSAPSLRTSSLTCGSSSAPFKAVASLSTIGRGKPPDVEGGRTVPVSGDAALAARFERDEMVGAAVEIDEPGRFRMASGQDEVAQMQTAAPT